MHCAVAAVSSPIFTPSPRKMSPVFCKPATAPPPLSLTSASSFLLKQVAQPINGGGEEEGAAPSKASPALKRKRPARINIPVTSLMIDEDKTASDLDRSSEVVFEGAGYSVYSKRGKRRGVLEDRYAVVLSTPGDSKQAFFGVFDGHGGAGAAEFASTSLEKNIMKEVLKRGDGEIEEAVKEGYLATDYEFLKKDIRGGTCCVTAFVHKEDLVVSNTGDCRAVMSRRGVAEALTVDHRPSLDKERARIVSMGGYVDCCNGVWRVHGSLAVSRAIGDRHLKQWVVAEPETKVFKIRPECEFLILASDGLWDHVRNQEAVDIVRALTVGVEKPDSLTACKKLMDLSLTRGSLDDISVMVIQLSQFIR